MNKEKINEAITTLARAYSTNNPALVEKSIKILRDSDESFKVHEPINGTTVLPVDASIFYTIGVPWWDQWIRGVRKKEFVLFAGVPYSGKTHLLGWFGSNALLQGAVVADVFAEDLVEDKQAIYKAGTQGNKKALKNLWLYEIQERGFSLTELEGVTAYFRSKGIKLDVLILDHMDALSSGPGYYIDDDWRAVAAKSKGLKNFAKREDLILVSGSQAVPLQGGGLSLYAGKTTKRASVDILIFITDSQGSQYVLTLDKAKGRKILPGQQVKMVIVNWDTMEIREV